jgi:hypothetical protein
VLHLLGILATAPGFAYGQGLGNFCPIGTCDITNPHYVNVYWDSSLAQWDTDVAATTTDMRHQALDDLTEALVNSQYFATLTQYSVTSVTVGPSISTAGCMAAPSDLDTARSNLGNLANCLLKLYPSLKADNTILNVFVPPQSKPVSLSADFCSKFAGEHGEYGSPVQITFLPTNSACNPSLNALFGTVTHEMTEGTTDPNPPSPTGWKVNNPGDFFGQEVADVCQSLKFSNVPFLFSTPSVYWTNSGSTCVSGFALTPPTITKATSCGTGQAMTLTLTGTFGGVPWDLASKKFGKQTLYLNARINHAGKVWEAGNFEGLPNDGVNQGKPDVVNFGPGGVTWSPGTITVAGFDGNYGKTMGNGAVAKVSPGDPILVKVALNNTGQFASATINAPGVSQILNLAVTPISPDPYVFVNRKAQVTGMAADAGNCGVQEQTVALMGWQGMVSPGQVGTSSSGAFQADYFAPSVAGTQKVNATLWNNNAVKASVDAPVHPILNAITPNIGPVAGGQKATLSGDGFDPGNTTVDFGGASAKPGTVALQSIQVVTPKSPLGGDGDGIVDVTATVNGLASLAVPYQYIVPGRPYINFKSTNCKTHYIVVTVYDDNAQPVMAPILLTANYQAYFSNGQWVSSMNTTTGVWVQVDKGGPFTATNTNKNLSNTASFPVLPGPICYNVKLIAKVDWHIFEKPDFLTPQEVTQINPGERAAIGGKKVVVWTKSANVKDATSYVLGPVGTAGGGLQVRTVGAEQFRGIIHGRIFLSGSGGMKTESAPGEQTGNVLEVQFVGPAFSIARSGQREDAVAPLGRELRLTFGLPPGQSFSETFHILHLTTLDGQPTWVEDGTAEFFSYGSGVTRGITQTGIYALIHVVGSATETGPQQQQQRQEQPQQEQPQPQRQTPPATPQAAPPNSTILVPDTAFPGGVLTGVVIGPDDQPVPNTPVEIAGGVPATLTGEVIGEQPSPCPADNPDCQPAREPQRTPTGQPAPAPQPPVDCASLLQQANLPGQPQGTPATGAPTPGQANNPAGTATQASASGPQALTDAAGRFALCMAPTVPQVNVNLPGGSKVTIKPEGGQSPAPDRPPDFFQPDQKISVKGRLRDPRATQNGRTWLLPAVVAWSPDGRKTITAFKTPKQLTPGTAQISYIGSDGRQHQTEGTVFRILRAFIDRAQLHSNQGATFEYDVQFAPETGQSLCVEMHIAGPIVLMQPPAPVISIDANGLGRFGGKIRATQVTPGAAVPFDITPNIHICSK